MRTVLITASVTGFGLATDTVKGAWSSRAVDITPRPVRAVFMSEMSLRMLISRATLEERAPHLSRRWPIAVRGENMVVIRTDNHPEILMFDVLLQKAKSPKSRLGLRQHHQGDQ